MSISPRGWRLQGLPNQAALCRRQPGAGAERRPASWRGAQADGQGGSPAGGDRLLEPTAPAQAEGHRAARREDFAACMSELVDVHYPEAERIRVVLDNLSTHSAGALYQTFPACEARRVLRRLEFHFVPKHASWLNMVEIEIGVRATRCLDRRIEGHKQLAAETVPLGARTQCRWRSHQMVVHNRKGPRENRTSLSVPEIHLRPTPKSQNLYAEVLARIGMIRLRLGA
jgi:DDE superfamily endonuclease